MVYSLCRTFLNLNFKTFSVDCLIKNVKHFQFHSPVTFRLRQGNVSQNIAPILSRNHLNITIRQFSSTSISRTKDIDTKVVNNVILYKYDGDSYFKRLNIFGVVQFFLFGGFGYSMRDFLPKREEYEPLLSYVARSSIQVALVIFPPLCAVLTVAVLFMLNVRTIKYIILKKGGQKVTFITFHPFKKTHQITVPVEQTYVTNSRERMPMMGSVKLAPKWFFYIIQKDGKYVNPDLFDCTVGTAKLKKKK